MEAELPEVASKIQRLEALALAGTGFHQIIATAVTQLKTGIIKFCQLFDLDPRLRIQRRFWEAVLAARADIPRTVFLAGYFEESFSLGLYTSIVRKCKSPRTPWITQFVQEPPTIAPIEPIQRYFCRTNHTSATSCALRSRDPWTVIDHADNPGSTQQAGPPSCEPPKQVIRRQYDYLFNVLKAGLR
jgi:hypothetical protein